MNESRMRRRMLARLAAGAALAAGGIGGFLARALAKGDLAHAQGVQRIDGSVTVGGRPAAVGTPVAFGDRVATGPNSTAVVVVGQDAFLLRADTVIVTRAERGTLSQLLVETGRVLSVFSKKPLQIKASMASIGIRGTGAYIEIGANDVYFCLCYGEAEVDGPRMPPRLVKTTHHEQPLLLTQDDGVMQAAPGPFRNHTDAELVMLEALVGREPPFMKGGKYPSGPYGSSG
ncbi:MAG TPA: hypothetical protein VFE23_16985 [Usitatibacter sp.]|jgi:hypothetical protein|nr:hypothetical protein [Usitatibacter sp.]